MTGDDPVTNRFTLPPLARAFLTIAGILALVDTFNVFTAIHDAAEHGQRLSAWEPAVWESTSGVATLLACGSIYAAVRMAPPGRTRWPKFVIVHALASLLFSASHVLLMNAMRVVIYAAAGHHYRFDESGFMYEYRKDLIAYIVWAAIFWLFTKQPPAAGRGAADDAPIVVIQDGRRLMRVAASDILAVKAAGNYVEFMLADGRTPLARKSLRQAQDELGERSFVRTHRSWLINIGRVRSVAPVGAGDFRIELDGGAEAPLSRRFPEALVKLKASGTASATNP
ncbi:MAG TPA: LytTR family DNA-binding domain-containing protein [Sphingomicrobium sp.]|nr:LytTR family DNA-binding domain-containing protein [Sphingomicrobium sp.]